MKKGNKKMKKKKVKWTSEEVEALLDGIEKHGRKWVSILKDPQFASSLANRSNIDLKDKWRNFGRIRSCDVMLHTKKKVKPPRQDYLMRSPSKSGKKTVVESDSEDCHTPCTTRKRRGTSSIIEKARKSRVVEELSYSEGYRIPCAITRERRWTRNSIISEVRKIRAAKELYESQEYLNPCTIARQRRGTLDNMINQASEERVVEELSNPCTITYQRRGTRDNMTNQASKERVVEELSDFKDHLNPCIITYQRRRTRDNMTNQAGEERVVEELSDSQGYHIPCTITRQRRWTRSVIMSEASCKSVVEELNESHKYLNPCLSTLQRRVTRSIMKKQVGEERVVEDSSDSKDYYNPCTIALQRRRTRSSLVNQTMEESVVEELSDSLDYLKSPTTTCKGKGTCNSKISHASKIRVVEELSDSQDYHNPCTIARQTRGTRRNRINQAKKLDSEEVHSYLEKIWVSFPEDKKSSFMRLDPLWYTLYSDDSNKEKVLNWIRKKDIFSKSYVIFPIVQWGHWSVLIFCHFGESIGSKFKTPCILLLDSLAKADHSQQLEPIIRKFVLDIYKNAERTEDIRLLRKMPFLVPKVPQQRDGEECGFFVLYYIKLFVENAPETFSISDGYPYFMNKDWFSCEGLDSFFRALDTSHDSI